MCISCIGIHIFGVTDAEEHFPHEIYCCGTFFGFAIIAIFGIIAVLLGLQMSILFEAFSSLMGFVLFVIVSMVSMYYVENDSHMLYLTDKEEIHHQFFIISKAQV